MCGLAGVVRPDVGPIDTGFATVMRHRGPDQEGVAFFGAQPPTVRARVGETEVGQLALIHFRLSILDVRESAGQPMADRDGRFWLIYNGEVYNYIELRRELEALGHVFETGTDSEVVLHALMEWGPGALDRFEGMWALAFLDRERRELLLARDPFGIKPLYYGEDDGALVFASEMKALLRRGGIGRKLAPGPTYEFLRYSLTDHREDTLVSGIRQLPAGCFARVSLGSPTAVRTERYYQFPTEARDETYERSVRRVREAFLRSIELHLRSDVPLGAALSGGIDSSSIVGAVREVSPDIQLHTFSYVADDPSISEERWVDVVNAATGAVEHKISLGREDFDAIIDDLILTQDEPFGSTSILAQYAVFRKAREAGMKVMLDGQGADELLGGYLPFLGVRLTSLVGRAEVRQALSFYRAYGRQHGYRHAAASTAGYLIPSRLQEPLRRLIGRESLPNWINRPWFEERGAVLRPAIERPLSRNFFHEERCRSTRIALPHLLRYADRNSMRFSIESRVPFLSRTMAETLLRLPEEHAISPDGRTKHVVRDAMAGLVPEGVLSRRDKIGFRTPEHAWMRNQQAWVDAAFEFGRALPSCPFDFRHLDLERQRVEADRRPYGSHLWRAANLLAWARRHEVQM